MSYTNEELEGFLASGDAQKNEDGSITWAVDNAFDKKPGTWLVRPPKAAPLIDSELGVEYAGLRREKRRQVKEEGFAIGIGRAVGQVLEEMGKTLDAPLTTDESLSLFVARVAEAAYKELDPRMVGLMFRAMELEPQKKVEVDQRRQTINITASQGKLIEQFPAVQRLLEQNGE